MLREEARSIAIMPLPRVLVLIVGYFRQSLTRLVQNLTLRNDCNLITSAHGTQQLSSHIDHWTKGELIFPFQIVDNAHLLPWVVASRIGFQSTILLSKGRHSNQYTTIVSTQCSKFLWNWKSQKFALCCVHHHQLESYLCLHHMIMGCSIFLFGNILIAIYESGTRIKLSLLIWIFFPWL